MPHASHCPRTFVLALALLTCLPPMARASDESQEWLARVEAVLISVQTSASGTASEEGALALVRLGPGCIPTLCELLPRTRSEVGSSVRQALVGALRKFSQDDVTKAVRDLGLGDAGVAQRVAALCVLEALADDRHTELAFEIVQSLPLATQSSLIIGKNLENTVVAIAQRNPRTMRKFSEHLPNLSLPVTGHVVRALCSLGSSESLSVLAESLRPGSAQNSILLDGLLAADLSSLSLSSRGLSRIRSVQADADSGVARRAALASAKAHDVLAVPSLLEALDHAEAPVRSAATTALRILSGVSYTGSAAWRTWYEQELRWREENLARSVNLTLRGQPQEIVSTLRSLGGHKLWRDSLTPALVRLLEHGAPEIRAAACPVLAQLGDLRAKNALQKALTDGNPLVKDRARAAIASVKGRF